ncbi:MAG: amidase [Haloechinothrix sp.]
MSDTQATDARPSGRSSADVDELAYLSATDAIRLFRSRDLSPVELLRAVAERVDRLEPRLNAFSDIYLDDAVRQARAAEARYVGQGEPPRALEGIPLAVKEEAAIRGLLLTHGSLLHRDQVADASFPIADRVLTAGAVVHARTTTPEFCCACFTHSRLWGVTPNPWNRAFSCGGSSGGAAVSLAAGMTTLATGSDIAGSIRIPASSCGVVGFKPPYGRVPALPPWNLDHYCHDGPMARTVADCALLANVVAGPHPTDLAALPPVPPLAALAGGVAGWRLAISVDLGGYEVDDEVTQATLAAADVFRAAGATVEPVELDWSRHEIVETALAHYGAIFGRDVAETIAEQPDLATPYARTFAQQTTAALERVGYLHALKAEGRIMARLGELLCDYQLLLCPTLATPAFAVGEDYVDTKVVVNGVELDSYWEAVLTIPFNICSRCPVLSIPSGVASSGVPIGLQVVGRPYDDVSVFQAAAAFERAQPWLDVAARRPRV